MANEESKVLLAIADLKNQMANLARDVRTMEAAGTSTKVSVDELRKDMNGRFKKLEHTVFGNEEADKIGLVEKVRRFGSVAEIIVGDETKGLLPLVERIRSLESGWAKLTAVGVLACSLVVEAVKLGWHWFQAYAQSGAKTHP